MEVTAQLQAPVALAPGIEHPVPIGYDAGWAQVARLNAVEYRKISYPCRESNPDHQKSIVRRYPAS